MPSVTAHIPTEATGTCFRRLPLRALEREGKLSRLLRASAVHLDSLSVRKLLPLIFAAQLATLFIMETLEQRIVLGHVQGGTIWLGGPVLVSLCLHAIGCVLISCILSRGLQKLAKRIADAVCYALATLILQCDLAPAKHRRREPVALAQFLEPFIERLKGRAPPQPAV